MKRRIIASAIYYTILFLGIIPISCSISPDSNTDLENFPYNTQSSPMEDTGKEASPASHTQSPTPISNIPTQTQTPAPMIEEIKSTSQKSRIAFTGMPFDGKGLWYLYVMNEDGTEKENIANISGDSINFRWSTDGNKLAVSRLSDFIHELFILDLETKQKTWILEERTCCTVTPFWSPDGDSLAFISNHDLVVAGTDGTGFGTISHGAWDISLLWNSDNKITFIKDQNKVGIITLGTQLIEMESEADFFGLIRLYPPSWSPPSWSSTGEYFVAEGVKDPTDISFPFGRHIVMFFTDGRPPINLTGDQEDQNIFYENPMLSKSGEQITFIKTEYTENRKFNSSIWVMNIDGTNQRMITDFMNDNGFSPGHNYHASNGQYIAFSPRISDDDERGWHRNDIFSINLDGTELKNLTEDMEITTILDFAWSP